MSRGGGWRAFEEPLRNFFGSGRFANSLSLVIVGAAFSTFAILRVVGWPGLVGALTTMVVLATVSFVARRGRHDSHGLLPISLIVFVGWCTISVFWSENPATTIASSLYQLAWAYLAIYLAMVRDTIQVVRVVGDVLRFLLAGSLALEVFSGLVASETVHYLGVSGTIAHFGPIQGIFGSRNALALISVIALVTFFVEWRTRSVTRGRAALSLPLAAISLALSRSPVAVAVIALVVVAALFLTLLRSIRDERRRFSVQVTLAVVSAVAAAAAWVLRDPIIGLLDARSMLNVRHALWIQIWDFSRQNPLVGWGWTGIWRGDEFPFSLINAYASTPQSNGLNAYLDVLLQLGWVGVLVFGVLVVLALGRSWLVASNKRSVIHTWTPLVLLALLATSATESVALVDYGWVLLVICTVNASQNMSWRSAVPGPSLPTRGPL
ncbi:O-antigen ligase family protein [Gryllotalpicola protaetiae]|uniref:O-antigen ligase family protein n=1 Tax=Gryllotalpicola protaetiae TaxID=2419771 RepID=UPI001FEA9E79|nr:O-antigen ligase family protein [Gryllotalpicola protaetiae]